MRAVLVTGSGKVGLSEVAEPRAEAGEMVLETAYAVLCPADAWAWAEARSGSRPSLARIPGRQVCARDSATGGLYAVWPGTTCGRCDACRTGRENLCLGTRIMGLQRHGGLAERLAVPVASLIPVLDALPPRLAALAEAAGRGLNALRRAGTVPGERVLVVGSGPVGLLAALAAKQVGAHPFVRGHPRAAAFLAAAGIEGGPEAPPQRFEVALDTGLAAETITDALAALVPGGRLCLAGRPRAAVVLEGIDERELAIVGAGSCTRDQMGAGLSLLARCRKEVELLVESEVTLAEVPALLPRLMETDPPVIGVSLVSPRPLSPRPTTP